MLTSGGHLLAHQLQQKGTFLRHEDNKLANIIMINFYVFLIYLAH